ncbi:MAG TPA: hypothetical protein VGR73_01480 [Bryobacteraceae bacterium]|nr:hypothetical protein [Bryobacteraceae bacterium]
MRKIVISNHAECHAAVFHFVETANAVQKELVFSRRLLADEQQRRFSAKLMHAAEIYKEACRLKEEFKLGREDLFILVVDGNICDDEDDEYFSVSGTEYAPADEKPSQVAIISLFFLNSHSTFMKDGGGWWASLNKAEQARKKSECVLLLILCAVTSEITDLAEHPETRGCIMDYCQSPTEIIEAATGRFQFCVQECWPTLSLLSEGQALAAIARSLSEAPLPIHTLEPAPSAPVPRAGTVVMSIHGIRTRGAWQKMLTSELNEAGFKHEPLDYGFFRAVQLLIPRVRAAQVRWFLEEYTRIRQPPERAVSVIAHSFGTYIIAGALEKYSEMKLDSIILCGSIVRRDYPWSRLVVDQVRCVLNDYGRLDVVCKVAEWFIADAGPSGAKPFTDDAGGRVQQRFRPRFRHSDYFYRLNYQQTWIPFLQGQALTQGSGGEKGFRNWRFLVTKIAAALALLGFGLILWRLTR